MSMRTCADQNYAVHKYKMIDVVEQYLTSRRCRRKYVHIGALFLCVLMMGAGLFLPISASVSPQLTNLMHRTDVATVTTAF